MARPQCSVFIAASLDGFIARPSGAIDWLSIVERPGKAYGWKAFFDSVDTLLMGRKTYETALGFDAWPYAGKRCVVLTHEAPRSRHGEAFYRGDFTELVERLGAEGARRVYVDGGTVIAQLLGAQLIDDVTVSVIPVLLGEGAPLAPAIGRDVRLALTGHRAFESGLVQLRYRVMAGVEQAAAD
ncbi:MAG: dihydrofolate reductase [Myxococcales bacterium]|nr:dihydrofolate reductase [Myxococcales bacterium]